MTYICRNIEISLTHSVIYQIKAPKMNINLLLLRKCNKIPCTLPLHRGSLCPYMQLSWVKVLFTNELEKLKPNWLKILLLIKPGSSWSHSLVKKLTKFTCTLSQGEKKDENV